MSVSNYITATGTSIHLGGGRSSSLNSTTVGVHIGSSAGDGSTVVGYRAGRDCSPGAVCIGHYAGNINAGTNSILIGNFAGTDSARRYNNVVMLNASGSKLEPATDGAFYCTNIRRSDGTLYSRSIDFTAEPPGLSFVSTGTQQEYTIGSFTIEPDSSGVSGEFYVSNFRMDWSNTPVVITPLFRIYNNLGVVVDTFSANLSTQPTTGSGDSINFAYSNPATKAPYPITASLYNNATLNPITYTIRAVIPAWVGGGAVRLYIYDSDLDSQQALSYHFQGDFQLQTTTLPKLYYDSTTGEISYF